MADFNPYETRRLFGIVGRLPRRSNFLQKMFFGRTILPTGARKIAFDEDEATKGIALLCHPLVAGRPVKEGGFTTREIEPAYTQPWIDFNAMGPVDRAFGEDFAGPNSPAMRQAARLVKGFNKLMRLSFTLYERMCYEAVSTGQTIVSGEGIATPIVIDYGRASSFEKTLTSTARWGETGVSPLDDISDWVRELAAENGIAPNRVACDPLAGDYIRADPKFEKMVNQDYKRQTPGTVVDLLMLDAPTQGILFGVLKSGGGQIELWEYQQTYLDEAGATQKIMADNTVIVGYEGGEITQSQCFGTIIDPELNYTAETMTDPETGAIAPMAPWHAFKKKPAKGEMIGLQSAPLMALTERNGILFATVR